MGAQPVWRIMCLIAIMASVSATASAFDKGNDLLSALGGSALQNSSAMMFIRGNVDGVVEGYAFGHKSATGESLTVRAVEEKVGHCVPQGVTNGQLADVVTKYLRDNPEQRHKSATVVINRALSAAFPCH